MFIKSFPAGPWQTNCYVVSTGVGNECLIVDPGMHASTGIRDVVEENHLKPVAVLVTHGHIDHMWSLFPVAKGYGIPGFIHGDDRYLLSDPGAGLSPETAAALPTMLGTDDIIAEPEDLRIVTDNMSLNIAGMDLVVRHAPGHTWGSVLFDFQTEDRHVFTGDVLFAGAIGRTDLANGSPEQMNDSLRNVILPLPDSAIILPGHGRDSRMNIERATNQYLLRIAQGLPAA